MKLQGKGTGKYAGFIGFISPSTPTVIDLPSGEPMLTVRYTDAGTNCFKDYKTIAEFNADWEDYKPAEPLIKDEKIRKAVRSWAEANGIDVIVAYILEDGIEFAGNATSLNIRFTQSLVFDTDRRYTIAELCGEEEE